LDNRTNKLYKANRKIAKMGRRLLYKPNRGIAIKKARHTDTEKGRYSLDGSL